MNQNLEILIGKLQQVNPDIDALEVADMLWLSQYVFLDKKTETISDVDNHNELEDEHKETIDEDRVNSDQKIDDNRDTIEETKEDSNDFSFDKQRDTSNTIKLKERKKERFFDLKIARQLKPLKRKISSHSEMLLDIDQTIDFIAQTGVYQAILEPKDSKEFSLSIIVDQGLSMFLWEEVIADFKKNILSYGIFDKINFYYLSTDEQKVKLFGDKNQTLLKSHKIAELNHRKNITFILSDCVSLAWRSNSVYDDFINFWTKHSFVAIVQMLPQRMWKRTPLNRGYQVNYKTNSFITPLNSSLDIDLGFVKRRVNNETLKIPIISFDNYSFEYISKIITAIPNVWINGVALNDFKFKEFFEDDEEENMTAQKRVAYFFSVASPEAQNLAIYCSVLPLSIGIIKEVQKIKNLKQDITYIAEFYFGKLLKKSEVLGEFDFYDGVRELLRVNLNATDAFELSEGLSNFIKEDLGTSIGFNELLYSNVGEKPLSDKDRELVNIFLDTFRRKGGRYLERYKSVINNISNIKTKEKITTQYNLTKNIFNNKKAYDFYDIQDAVAWNIPVDSNDVFYTDFTPYRTDFTEKRIFGHLNINPNTSKCNPLKTSKKIFLSGYRGIGKTSELLSLTNKIDETKCYFTLFVDISEEKLDTSNIETIDILILMLKKMIERLEELGVDVKNKTISDFDDWYKSKIIKEVNNSVKGSEQIEVDLKTDNTLLGLIGLVTNTQLKLRGSNESKTVIRREINKNFSMFIIKFNEFVVSLVSEFREKGHYQDILFILDGFEKIGSFKDRKKILVDYANKLTIINAHMIVTLPIELFTEKNRLNHFAITENFPLIDLTIDGAKSCFREFILKRIDEKLFKEDSIEKIIEYGAGHIQQTLRLINRAYVEAEGEFIDMASVDKAIEILGAEMPTISYEEIAVLKKVKHQEVIAESDVYTALKSKNIIFQYNSSYESDIVNPIVEADRNFQKHLKEENFSSYIFTKKYKAFISYSHEDEAFGLWLHKELEKYKIPKKLREDYPNLPKTLYPIFRDRYELNSGDDLGVEIHKVLENSDALIVVCSTKSADSKWVNKEIIDFKMMYGEDRIFPIILDGEPFARESDNFDDELECFPEALKYRVDSEGNLTNEQTSILASSAIEKEDGRELAKLKLIAGVLGVSFGEFYRREERPFWQKGMDTIKDTFGLGKDSEYKKEDIINDKMEDKESTQDDFVTKIFNTLKTNRLVTILSQDLTDITDYQDEIKKVAKINFGDKFYHIEIPSMVEEEAIFFQKISENFDFHKQVQSANQFRRIISLRIKESKKILLVVTGIEENNEILMRKFSIIVRGLSVNYSNFYTILIGRKSLANLIYANSSLSPLNTAVVIFFPNSQIDLDREYIISILSSLKEYRETMCKLMKRENLGKFTPWSQNEVINELFWKNLLINKDGFFTWNDNVLYIVNEIIPCKNNLYQLFGGLNNKLQFFGRKNIIQTLLYAEHNYIIIGARTLGKSSISEELKRQYSNLKNIECIYFSIIGKRILFQLADALNLSESSTLDNIIQAILEHDKKLVFLIEEVEEFIKHDKENNYEIINAFRKLSEKGKATFIFTGHIELYKEVNFNYQSPLKNFAEVIELRGLEDSACRDLMIEPMKRIGVSYENDNLVIDVIKQCGNHPYYITYICNIILKQLDSRNIIKREDINNAIENLKYTKLNYQSIYFGNDDLSKSLIKIIIYLTTKKKNFTLKEIVTLLRNKEIDIEIFEIEKTLSLMVVSYILNENNATYSYAVPLMRDVLLEQLDISISMDVEVRKLKNILQ